MTVEDDSLGPSEEPDVFASVRLRARFSCTLEDSKDWLGCIVMALRRRCAEDFIKHQWAPIQVACL